MRRSVKERTAVADVLVRIVECRQRALEQAGYSLGDGGLGDEGASATLPAALPSLSADSPGRLFLDALYRQRGNAVIAEVKLGSPKLGDLRQQVVPEAQARIYRDGGAAALSVVVEPDHFFGSYELLERCCRASGLPAIAKDFVVSEQQFRWARDAGAGAVLLIAALYETNQLWQYAAAAQALGLVPLIETHTAEDVAKLRGPSHSGPSHSGPSHRGPTGGGSAGASDIQLVGVNNRDLRTFAVDIENSVRLRPSLPAGSLAVAESGIATRGDIERLGDAGFDAFLIGESLLLAEDPGSKLAELLGTVNGGPL